MSFNVLITGASGFVGRALCEKLVEKGVHVSAAVRTQQHISSVKNLFLIPAIDCQTHWEDALQQIDVVIHLGARVHVMHERSANPLAEFREVNVEGTEHLARSAAAAGVKRMVYVSSIKVNGEETVDGRRYAETDVPSPLDPYGTSKWEAEQAMYRVAAETGLEVVIVRPPLVYGPGVKGNFAQMLRTTAKGIPLPFSSVRNQRSLVYVRNLSDALTACAMHPNAAGQAYLVSDGNDISTPELLRELASGMGQKARLFPCPPKLLEWAGKMVGKSNQVQRLLGSLQIDSGKIRRELNWTPPYTLQQGLQATAEWYRNTHL